MKEILLEQNTPQWLEWRRSKIGASDAPIIMGLSPWQTPEDLRDVKLEKKKIETTSRMQRGKDLEENARQKFIEMSGIPVEAICGVHEINEWMAASFDGVSPNRKIFVEIKCPNKKDHLSALNGIIPAKYIAQLQHQLEVLEVDTGFYFSFDGENGVVLEFQRDQDFIDEMLRKEYQFWISLQENNPL